MILRAVKLDEENPKCAGLAQEIVLGQHNCTVWRGWCKTQQRCAAAEKSVINMI